MADTDAAKAEKIAAAKKRVSGVVVVHNPDYPNLPSENSLPDTCEHSFPLPVPPSGLGLRVGLEGASPMKLTFPVPRGWCYEDFRSSNSRNRRAKGRARQLQHPQRAKPVNLPYKRSKQKHRKPLLQLRNNRWRKGQ